MITTDYPNDPEQGHKHLYNNEAKAKASTVKCACGNTNFQVNWLRYPYTGGYLKLTCENCGSSEELFDDNA